MNSLGLRLIRESTVAHFEESCREEKAKLPHFQPGIPSWNNPDGQISGLERHPERRRQGGNAYVSEYLDNDFLFPQISMSRYGSRKRAVGRLVQLKYAYSYYRGPSGHYNLAREADQAQMRTEGAKVSTGPSGSH
jgi:hypothetical protein